MIVQFHCSGENKDGKKTSIDFRFEGDSNVATPLTTIEFLEFCKKCKEEEYIHLRGQLKYSVEGVRLREGDRDIIVLVYVEEDYDLKEAIKRKCGRMRIRVSSWINFLFNKA